MGCFDYADAVTGVSIHWGDEVLQVIGKEKWVNENYDVFTLLWDYHRKMTDGDGFSRYMVEMDDLKRLIELAQKGGDVNALKATLTATAEARIKELTLEKALEYVGGAVVVRWGTYNDYGWIEDSDDRDDPALADRPTFMVSKKVALDIARREGFNTDDVYEVACAVCHFLFLCRINPWHCLGGTQGFEKAELDAHLFRINLIQQALDAKEKWWEKEEE